MDHCLICRCSTPVGCLPVAQVCSQGGALRQIWPSPGCNEASSWGLCGRGHFPRGDGGREVPAGWFSFSKCLQSTHGALQG